ncbi:hypothetical protein BGZ60DRAFT_522247 [Tricladium varicosporioides]|nr:hypothetical protein BGZ60DRAFT_522247 [Hymenoscyphus varicosporioides]
MPPSFLPNHRLLARAFYRVPVSRPISISSPLNTRELEDHTAREESHNVRHKAIKEGRSERTRDKGGRGAGLKSGVPNEKVKREFPGPGMVGM